MQSIGSCSLDLFQNIFNLSGLSYKDGTIYWNVGIVSSFQNFLFL
jgi:hypothetical protein